MPEESRHPNGNGAAAGSGSSDANTSPDLISQQADLLATIPEGLMRDIATFVFWNAHYPNFTIALVASIGLLAGICGRAYNVNDAGLNLYLLLLAPTGTGKEAIADGISRLLAAVELKLPKAREFRGPGELVSAPGLVKWLARLFKPSTLSIIGEFGFMVEAMTGKNPNPNMKSLKGVLLKLYHKSGKGSVFDDIAYSEKDNNPGILRSPAYTIVGEGTPGFYDTIDTSNIDEGFLSRLNIHETNAKRPYRNENRITEPDPALVDRLLSLVEECFLLNDTDKVRNVFMMWEASVRFGDFEKLATDEINKTSNAHTKQLWNRAALKATKYAAIAAVGRSPTSPRITREDCRWATTLIFDQTVALISKFESGETGAIAGNEGRQEAAVMRCVKEYCEGPFERFENYGVTRMMHMQRVFTQSYLSKRLRNLPAFANDRMGPTKALERTLHNLAHITCVFQEFPIEQMKTEYGVRARSYTVSDPKLYFAMIEPM